MQFDSSHSPKSVDIWGEEFHPKNKENETEGEQEVEKPNWSPHWSLSQLKQEFHPTKYTLTIC